MNVSDPDEVLIEEIDSNDVPEGELSQFMETEPLRVVTILDDDDDDDEANLIQRYVHGDAEFPDIYTKLEPYEKDDDVEEEEDDEVNDGNHVESDNSNANANTRSIEADTSDTGDNNNGNQMKTVYNQVDTYINYNYGFQRKQKVCRKLRKRDDDLPSTSRNARLALPSAVSGVNARKKSILNVALQGLMGEANLCFARGQLSVAEKICLEIIRQNPLAPEPFFTLAELYESRDTEKFLNFLTIAVHLDPSDRYQWIRIAEMHIAQGNLQRARLYYTRALKVHYRDYDLRLRKGRLLEMMGEKNHAMFTYLKMIQHCPAERHELCLATAKNVARHFHTLNKPHFALEAMESAYAVCGAIFSLEDINLYLELLILNKEYSTVVHCLRERTSLELDTGQEAHHSNVIYFCVIPDDYVPDIRAKLCVALISLKAHHLLGYLIQNMHENVPPLENDRLNLYCDIAEALMQEHKYAEAISLLNPITDGDVIECPAFIWLKQAECLRHLNRCQEAIESFNKVVELAPYCYEAKFTLSALLKQQGRHVEAVKALEQSGEEEGQPLHARLLYERCIMLQQINEIDEFLEIGCVLLGRMSVKLRNREEMLAAANGCSFYNSDGLKTILQMRNIIGAEAEKTLEWTKAGTNSTSDDLSVHDEYQLFLELMRTAYLHKNYSVLQRMCFAMVTTKRFTPYHMDLERIIILACYFNDDCTIAFSYLRELIHKNATSIHLWNLLSLLVQKGQDLRYHRYINRLIQRRPVAKSMRIFTAHYHLHCSSYKYALNVYMPLFKEQPSGILALCIAIIFQQISLQKRVLRKSAGVAQALVFAHRYGQLRSTAYAASPTDVNASMENSVTYQEIMYNIGRIYHQCGMFHLAVEYYERGLNFIHPELEEHQNLVGLKQEIAFNLHLIYRSSGNMRKARQYLYEYCVV